MEHMVLNGQSVNHGHLVRIEGATSDPNSVVPAKAIRSCSVVAFVRK